METKTYTYGDSSWADLLTKYNGKAITYDGIGNMLTYNGSTYTWMGRELRKITNGSNTYSYKYNADGIRTSKTVNGTTTEFFLNGSQILAQKTGDSVMRFFYDSTGKRVGFANGTMLFYYLYNLQGDVVAIVRAATGQVVAKYSYDAWGNCTVTNATGYAVGDKNPFRYRGYYYDTETGFYYVSSRYYDPEIGRFINADDIAYLGMGGLTSYNLFAYCGNNPVMGYDPYGTFDWSSFGKGAGWLAIGITAICVGVSVLTCGVAAPAMMAVAAVTVTAGALTAVNGVSELGEAATGHNFVRDDVFRGNEKAYDVYSNTTAAVAEIGTAICGGWTAKNAPRIKAYNNIQNYNYTDTISDVTHMSRPYANSVLTQKQVIKYGKMTKDSFGYVFSAMGSVNGKEKLWRLGINTAKGLVWHWGHGF